MPKVCSHWRYARHFVPLTMHCNFPPERAMSPPPITQHKVFQREVNSIAVAQLDLLPSSLIPSLPAKIPKPPGKVSRLKRGGYNLQETLGWSPLEYEEVRSFVIHLAREHLSVKKTWKSQLSQNLKLVFQEVNAGIGLCFEMILTCPGQETLSILNDYDGDWVVSDVLRVFLKNSSTCTS
ncbi:hypothetical protein F4604DRAFT_1582707 [Suillus subluteus]|nr:hypothetical protein F4604DRAFT_1582707 [Suillus subluteus]